LGALKITHGFNGRLVSATPYLSGFGLTCQHPNKYRVTDGIVPDRTGKILAGPNAVIPPPPTFSASKGAVGGG
jgi:hypothetical protein